MFCHLYISVHGGPVDAYAACGPLSLDALWRCINFRSWRHVLAAQKFASATTTTTKTLWFMAVRCSGAASCSKLVVERVVWTTKSRVDGALLVPPASKSSPYSRAKTSRHGDHPRRRLHACEIIQLSSVVAAACWIQQYLTDTRPYATTTVTVVSLV